MTRIICGVGAIALIVFGAVSLAGWIGETTETSSRSLGTAGISRVDVRTDAGAIVVNGGAPDTIGITQRVSYAFTKPRFRETVENGTLTLDARCNRAALGPCSASFTITVPAGVAVRARSGAGSISVRDIDATVDAFSSAGSVRAERVSGALTLGSSAGGIDAVDIRSSNVDADTSAGSIRLSFALAPGTVRARSDAGSVDVTVPDDSATYRVEADTGAGSTRIRVRIDPASERSIIVSSSAGSVTVEYPAG